MDWFLYNIGLRHERVKLTNRLSSLFRFKDVIPKTLQSHIVCKFPCDNYNVTPS